MNCEVGEGWWESVNRVGIFDSQSEFCEGGWELYWVIEIIRKTKRSEEAGEVIDGLMVNAIKGEGGEGGRERVAGTAESIGEYL
jgi:hypothetical protein